jgi:pyruvate ferredoxin oxidoreductase gamma subunit
MVLIRFHGLGGQGVVSAAHLMGKAAVIGDLWANSLPFFTTSQRGGKVSAYTRIDIVPIDQHCYIYEPDLLVIFHPLLLEDQEVMTGLKADSKILVNTAAKDISVPELSMHDTYLLNAEEIARSVLGIPVPSTVMAGAMIRILDNMTVANMNSAIEQTFGPKQAALNIKAVEMGYEACKLIGSTDES